MINNAFVQLTYLLYQLTFEQLTYCIKRAEMVLRSVFSKLSFLSTKKLVKISQWSTVISENKRFRAKKRLL